MNNHSSLCISLLQKEVCPALGCTEPIAVALAVSRSVEELGRFPSVIEIEVSANILKNGMGVGIPGTGMVGLDIAAALGAVSGKSKYGLEVLRDATCESIAMAKEMVDKGCVKIHGTAATHKLYIKAKVSSQGETASAEIIDCHDNIVSVEKNGVVVFSAADMSDLCAGRGETPEDSAQQLTVKKIFEFAISVDFKDIEFILQSATLNLALAKDGLENNYGLNVGKTVASEKLKYIFGDGIMSHAMSLSAAASDARMAGSLLPAMSNSGSGNQGITVTLPVVAVAQKIGVTDEKLARALVLSHLVAIHIKSYLGRLSALCGCVVASSGASCGIIYLLGGSYEQTTFAIKNMVG
ncbi:MAG: L-serine ammonia-lyase, iron-sulfur-dependent, subunit alpha, partial [Rikenellaceae bacterium]